MQSYKLDSSNNNIKFHRWKVQIGSNVSKGTILFLFKKDGWQNNKRFYYLSYLLFFKGNAKFEKYKSNIGGITIKSLSTINEDDCLESGYIFM
jgi:hypothetical protein